MSSTGSRVGKHASWTSASAGAMSAWMRTTAKTSSLLVLRTAGTGGVERSRGVADGVRLRRERLAEHVLRHVEGREETEPVGVQPRAEDHDPAGQAPLHALQDELRPGLLRRAVLHELHGHHGAQ